MFLIDFFCFWCEKFLVTVIGMNGENAEPLSCHYSGVQAGAENSYQFHHFFLICWLNNNKYRKNNCFNKKLSLYTINNSCENT